MNDAELLGQFVQDRSQAAFAELVRRHVDWVYSAALRRVRDAHLAEDVTQATFIVLATRASSLGKQRVLSAWLFHVVAHVSAQVIRREARRKRHEMLAAQQMQMTSQTDSMNPVNKEWEEISHLLDGAVERLRGPDREAVMLRFFEQKSFAEVGVALGITEEAARKRVARATDKLREILQTKRASMPAGLLGTVLLAEVTKPAPAGVVAAASGATTGAAAAGASMTLAKGAIAIMTWAKIKFAAVVVLASMLVVGGGVVVALQVQTSAPAPPPPAPNPPRVANAAPADNSWRIIFNSVYNLEDKEVVKRIEPPFIPERLTYYQVEEAFQARAIPRGPDYMTFHWENGQLKQWGMGFVGGRNPISGLLHISFGLESYEFEGADDLLKTSVPGDWIIRTDVPLELQLAALVPILSEATGKKLTMEKKTVLRDVVVVKGEYAFHADPASRQENELMLYVGQYKEDDGGGGGGGDFTKFLGRFGTQINMRMIDETTGLKPKSLQWNTQSSSYMTRTPAGPERDQNIQKLLDVVSTQTNLKFSKEQRNVEVWQLGPTGG